MAYSTQSDLESVWGTDNIAAWSDLTGGGTADTTRIASAISWADSRIDSRFRTQSRYEIPFGTASTGSYDPLITHWSAVLAGDWLYSSRQVRRRRREGEDEAGLTSAQVKRAEEQMDEVLANQATLDAGEKGTPMPDAPTCVY